MGKKQSRPTIFEAFGQALRAVRKDAGISQEELGFRSGVHRTFISEIERGQGNPSLETMDRLTSAMDTRIGAVIGRMEQILG